MNSTCRRKKNAVRLKTKNFPYDSKKRFSKIQNKMLFTRENNRCSETKHTGGGHTLTFNLFVGFM